MTSRMLRTSVFGVEQRPRNHYAYVKASVLARTEGNLTFQGIHAFDKATQTVASMDSSRPTPIVGDSEEGTCSIPEVHCNIDNRCPAVPIGVR